MNNNLWAIAALSLIACGPNPGGNTDTTNSSCTECMVDSDGNEYPLGTGAIFVHATYELEQEVCQVLDEDGNVIGNTEVAIFGLDPGVFNFALGDPDATTLDGRPFHVVNPYFAPTQSVPDETYTFGDSTVSVVAGEITQAEVLLERAPQYHCVSYQCDWPYEGGVCESMLGSEDQWIYVDSNDVLRGSDDDFFGGQYAGVITLNDDTLEFDNSDPNQVVMEWHFDAQFLSFGYTLNNNAAQAAVSVSCNLK